MGLLDLSSNTLRSITSGRGSLGCCPLDSQLEISLTHQEFLQHPGRSQGRWPSVLFLSIGNSIPRVSDSCTGKPDRWLRLSCFKVLALQTSSPQPWVLGPLGDAAPCERDLSCEAWSASVHHGGPSVLVSLHLWTYLWLWPHGIPVIWNKFFLWLKMLWNICPTHVLIVFLTLDESSLFTSICW